MNAPVDDDLDFEPVRVRPEHLPEGERILWQGAPEWPALARSAFHVVKVAFYFGLLILWRAATGAAEGEAWRAIAADAALLALIGGLAVAILAGLALAYAKTSAYTLTTRRLVIRSGLALPVTFNLPFTQVETAALSKIRGGIGSICFTVTKPNRVALLVVWPHAKPWAFANPEPALRSIRDAAAVARLAADALRREVGAGAVVTAVPVASEAPAFPAGAPAGMAA